MNEFMEFLRAVFINKAECNGRLGQSCFNVLWDVRPELAVEIRGTELDPFYDDTRVGAFLTRVCAEMTWGSQV